MTFNKFQQKNWKRCEAAFHPLWEIDKWALCIAGEAGELCNEVKKVYRGDFKLTERRPMILAELSDIITYCDLAMSKLGAKTEVELLKKFEIVSARVHYLEEAK